MLIINQKHVIERILVLHTELSAMHWTSKGVYRKKITLDPDLLILDVFEAVFGRRKGKLLCKRYLTGID